MLINSARQRSLHVYHLHMGGADAAALEVQSLLAPRLLARLRQAGFEAATSAAGADIVLVTGLLTLRNVDSVLQSLADMPSPSVLVAVGDSAANGGASEKSGLPGLAVYPLTHYVEVHLSVPGNPPTPQALLAALNEAARLLTNGPDDEGGG
jgi:Ni,Fe-hydrogenase III small subunit